MAGYLRRSSRTSARDMERCQSIDPESRYQWTDKRQRYLFLNFGGSKSNDGDNVIQSEVGRRKHNVNFTRSHFLQGFFRFFIACERRRKTT